MKRDDIRNVAIIAHVDHGKTTLVDQLMRQSGLFRDAELDRLKGGQHGLIMDSNDLERERGITILSKNIALQVGDIKVNIIDTPGHADFGGEVERVLRMADGALLLVDAAEGPLPQTRFVLRKAFEVGLRPIVVVNKIDRPDARPVEVLNSVFDLFLDLGADDAQLDFPTVYASGFHGYATMDLSVPGVNLKPMFDLILSHVPGPKVEMDAPLQMLTISLTFSEFVGRIGVGKVFAGKIRKNQRVKLLKHTGREVDGVIKQLLIFDRLARVEVDEVCAGDICAVVGLETIDIGDTIADPERPVALPPIKVDEPTLEMLFRINDSPFVGQGGEYVTSRQLRDRLMRELESNVALRVTPDEVKRDEFHVAGRGLLHLGILLENMRREGYEISVGKPKVINKMINGQMCEPIEYLVIDSPPECVGSVMELVGNRRAECNKMESIDAKMTHMEFTIPARGLIGLKTAMLTATKGMAMLHHTFYDYMPVKGGIPSRINGVMISTETGRVTGFALENLQQRGEMFVGPGDQVYEGQIVGEHCRDNDLPVNVCKLKPLTNMRASGSEKTIPLKPPKVFALEMALEYIEDDELVEITPLAIRLRKLYLKETDRKKLARQAANQA